MVASFARQERMYRPHSTVQNATAQGALPERAAPAVCRYPDRVTRSAEDFRHLGALSACRNAAAGPHSAENGSQRSTGDGHERHRRTPVFRRRKPGPQGCSESSTAPSPGPTTGSCFSNTADRRVLVRRRALEGGDLRSGARIRPAGVAGESMGYAHATEVVRGGDPPGRRGGGASGGRKGDAAEGPARPTGGSTATPIR